MLSHPMESFWPFGLQLLRDAAAGSIIPGSVISQEPGHLRPDGRPLSVLVANPLSIPSAGPSMPFCVVDTPRRRQYILAVDCLLRYFTGDSCFILLCPYSYSFPHPGAAHTLCVTANLFPHTTLTRAHFPISCDFLQLFNPLPRSFPTRHYTL